MEIKAYWQTVKQLLSGEASIKRFHGSLLWAIWIAFCPFIGLHTAIALVVSWFFSLNTAIVLSVSMLINNPWTMVPVYYIDYQVGVALLSLFSPEQQVFIRSNPQVLQAVLTYVKQYLPFADFSLFVFLLGGLFVSLFVTICAHFIFVIFVRLKKA